MASITQLIIFDGIANNLTSKIKTLSWSLYPDFIRLRDKTIKEGSSFFNRWASEARTFLRKNGKRLGKRTFINLQDGKMRVTAPQKQAKVVCEVAKAKTALGALWRVSQGPKSAIQSNQSQAHNAMDH